VGQLHQLSATAQWESIDLLWYIERLSELSVLSENYYKSVDSNNTYFVYKPIQEFKNL